MNITKEQSMAYTEVIEVLKYMSKEEVNKIPRDVMSFYYDNMDTSYDFKVDQSKSFEEQSLSEKAKVILAMFFRDYWSSDDQREKIRKKEAYDMQMLEEEKKEKYNSDDIFAKKPEKVIEEEPTSLVEYKKETWFSKFLQFMKRIFGSWE